MFIEVGLVVKVHVMRGGGWCTIAVRRRVGVEIAVREGVEQGRGKGKGRRTGMSRRGGEDGVKERETWIGIGVECRC